MCSYYIDITWRIDSCLAEQWWHSTKLYRAKNERFTKRERVKTVKLIFRLKGAYNKED